MKKRKKIILILLVLVVVGGAIGGGVAYYMWNKPHRDIEGATPDYEMSAEEFAKAYDNEEEGNKKFLNNVVLINGSIDEISGDGQSRNKLVMATGYGDIMASMDGKYMEHEEYKNEFEKLKKGDNVVVKCYCSGVLKDSLMGMVFSNIALKNCFIQSK